MTRYASDPRGTPEDRPRQRPRRGAARTRLDEATDIVAVVGGTTRERARAVLRAMSARTRIKERQVAELVVEWAVSGHLPADLRSELRHQLDGPRDARTAPSGQSTSPARQGGDTEGGLHATAWHRSVRRPLREGESAPGARP